MSGTVPLLPLYAFVDCVWNVMAHTQKPDFVVWRNRPVYLNRRGRQFSRLLAAEVWAAAVVMLVTQCSEVVWRVLAIHYIHQFPLHFPSRASPCAVTFQLDSTVHGNHVTFSGKEICREFQLVCIQARIVFDGDMYFIGWVTGRFL